MKPTAILAYSIRLASLLYSCIVIMGSIVLTLLGSGMPSENVQTVSSLLVIPLAATLIVSGHIYVGLAGRRMSKSRLHYVFAGTLLAVPLVLGGWLLTMSNRHELQPFGTFILLPASLLFVCAIWPLHVTSGGYDDQS